MNYKDFSYPSERKTNNITKLATQLALYQNLRIFQYSFGIGKKSGAVKTSSFLPYQKVGKSSKLLKFIYLSPKFFSFLRRSFYSRKRNLRLRMGRLDITGFLSL